MAGSFETKFNMELKTQLIFGSSDYSLEEIPDHITNSKNEADSPHDSEKSRIYQKLFFEDFVLDDDNTAEISQILSNLNESSASLYSEKKMRAYSDSNQETDEILSILTKKQKARRDLESIKSGKFAKSLPSKPSTKKISMTGRVLNSQKNVLDCQNLKVI